MARGAREFAGSFIKNSSVTVHCPPHLATPYALNTLSEVTHNGPQVRCLLSMLSVLLNHCRTTGVADSWRCPHRIKQVVLPTRLGLQCRSTPCVCARECPPNHIDSQSYWDDHLHVQYQSHHRLSHRVVLPANSAHILAVQLSSSLDQYASCSTMTRARRML